MAGLTIDALQVRHNILDCSIVLASFDVGDHAIKDCDTTFNASFYAYRKISDWVCTLRIS